MTPVVLVQKVFPLVPKRLWPVPAKRPPAVLGCWIRMTPISKRAVTTKRMLTKIAMGLLKGLLKPVEFSVKPRTMLPTKSLNHHKFTLKLDDGAETIRFQTGSAYQGTVNVRLIHQLLDVVRLHTPTILDTKGFGRLKVILLSN